MIVVFRNTQVYRDVWESDKRRLENSAVYSWASMYVAHEPYLIRPVTPLQYITLEDIYYDEDVADELYAESMNNENLKIMVNMAFEASLGFDLVFLCTTRDMRFHTTLGRFLRLFRQRYGISPRDIQSEDDIPKFPEDCDSFDKNGVVNFKLDQPIVQEIISDYVKDPVIAMVAGDQFKRLEVVL